MRVIGLVPARGGSKGVPRKNIRILAGKPLLQYTAEAALAARGLARTVLSTDDPEIAEIGRQCGLDVPFLRPAELAEDDTPTLPVVQHALRWISSRGEHFDAVCLLQPTTPLRLAGDIDGAIDLMERTGADSVISCVDAGGVHPAKMECVAPDGRTFKPPFVESFHGSQRRQDLPKVYLRAGSIYLTRTSVVMDQHSLRGADCRAWIIPQERACNVDTPFDLYVAELLLERWGEADAKRGVPAAWER